MLKKTTPLFQGFLHATGLAIYLILLSNFFMYVLPQMKQTDAMQYFAPIIMLLLFMISAVITASLVLARPAMLFWDKKYKQAFLLLGCTVVNMIFYLAFFIGLYLYIQ